MGFFSEPSFIEHAPLPHHNFAVIAPMIMRFVTGIKLDVFYTVVAKISGARISQTTSLIWLIFGI